MSHSQIQKPVQNTQSSDQSLSLGAHDDPSEQRVEREVASNTELRHLHGDRISGDANSHSPKVGNELPGNLSETLESSGSSLPQALRNDMESAFQTNFSHVRVHTDSPTQQAASHMGAAAFAANGHIGFANNLYQPDTPQGRGLIAHELGHVAEQSRGVDKAGIVRRNIFEAIGDFFAGAGSDFSELEISDYLAVLQGGDIEDNIDSDNKARYVVNTFLYPGTSETTAPDNENASIDPGTRETAAPDNENASIAVPLRQSIIRGLLVKEMATGIVADQDESAIMKVLDNVSSDIEREIIIREAGSDRLLDKIDDEDRKARLEGYILSRNNARFVPFPVAWQLDHSIAGGQLSGGGEKGLFIDYFNIRPEGEEDQRLRSNIQVPGQSDPAFPLTQPLPHPRNKGGEGRMEIRVGRTFGDQVVINPDSVPFPVDPVSYPSIPVAENQIVEAQLRVNLQDQEVGTNATETGSENQSQTGSVTTTGEETQRETTNETSTNNEISGGTETGSSQSQGSANRTGSTNSTSEESETSEGSTTNEENETSQSSSNTTGNSTTTTTGAHINIGGEIRGTISHTQKLELAGELGLELGDLGSIIPFGDIPDGLLRRILGRAAGPVSVLLDILQIVEGANAGLSLSLGIENRFEVSGTLSGEAGLRWQRAVTDSSSNTESSGNRNTQGSGTSNSQTDRTGSTSSSSNESENNSQQTDSSSSRTGFSNSTGTRNSTRNQQTDSSSTAVRDLNTDIGRSSRTETRRVLVSTVQSASLSFRVIRASSSQQEEN